MDHSTKRFKSTQFDNALPFRVAIVGGGVSGLSTALHLAPLVDSGIIAKPIDVYERSVPGDIHPHEDSCKRPTPHSNDESLYLGAGSIGRDIGVGVWNTALEPFLSNASRRSHVEFIDKIQMMGSWIGSVGYRNHDGDWLSTSSLDEKGLSMDRTSSDPALLFIKEKDFLSALREAVGMEEVTKGTINLQNSMNVEGVIIPSSSPNRNRHCGQLRFADKTISPSSYDIIISSEGIGSTLRSKYAGYEDLKRWERKNRVTSEFVQDQSNRRLERDHIETNRIEGRNYTVLRGNSPLSDAEAGMKKMSFQTWGKSKSMRFAAVNMSYQSSKDDRKENQVWFATISDQLINSIKDPKHRKNHLIESFKDWHHPICKLIESTPAESIIVEKAVAHKHSVGLVNNLSDIIAHCESRQSEVEDDRNDMALNARCDANRGPIILFSGDANMTVDPVLAQGFTIAMESAADISATLQSQTSHTYEGLNIALHKQNERRYKRIMCLLRATEIVSQLAQPSSGSFLGVLSNRIVRPFMKLVPNVLKEVIFSCTMKYSLGLYGEYLLQSKTQTKSGGGKRKQSQS